MEAIMGKKNGNKAVTVSRAGELAEVEQSGHAPPVYDPAVGQRELERLAPLLASLRESELAAPRVDVDAATFAALAVAGLVSAPEVRARFARLPKEELDPASYEGLSRACFAMLYALGEARAAGVLETEATIAAPVLSEAAELEQRMQRLCEYHLADDPVIGPELDRLRPGVGHRDLANDLLGYARIYELRAEVVKADPKHYREGDAPRARELAGVMIQALSAAMSPKARSAYDRYVRVWAVLERRYAEVRAAGLWLFRNDGRKESLFPSLFAAGRTAAKRRRGGAEEGSEGGGETPAPPPVG
jgi:hypothetical protein